LLHAQLMSIRRASLLAETGLDAKARPVVQGKRTILDMIIYRRSDRAGAAWRLS